MPQLVTNREVDASGAKALLLPFPMEDCTYYNNTSSYDHDDLVLSSSESTLSCFNASRNATQDSTEDEFVLTVVVGIVLGLVWIATMTGEFYAHFCDTDLNLIQSSQSTTCNATRLSGLSYVKRNLKVS